MLLASPARSPRGGEKRLFYMHALFCIHRSTAKIDIQAITYIFTYENKAG